MEIVKLAAAKINLLLDITARFENGYHSIYTIMQSVGLFDIIKVKKNNQKNKIFIQCSELAIPTDNKNTAFRAAEVFFQYTKINNSGANIEIIKNIPAQAGLGGASADAAAVIVALNELYNASLTNEELYEIGIRVGSDVPFCIKGGVSLVQDTGAALSYLPKLPPFFVVIVKPVTNVSTALAYSSFDEKDWIRHPKNEFVLRAAVEKDLKKLCSLTANVFEQVIDVPERIEIKAIMRSFNVMCSLMSGSGSSIFGIFETQKQAEDCYKHFKENQYEVFLTNPVNKGVLDWDEKENSFRS